LTEIPVWNCSGALCFGILWKLSDDVEFGSTKLRR